MILAIKNIKRSKINRRLNTLSKRRHGEVYYQKPHVSPPDNQEICSLHGNAKTESKNIFEQDPNNTNELDGSPGANIDDASHVEDDSFQPDIFDPRY
jgi:hypothetical protein